jgi:anti-sigma factor RsiW
MSNINLSDSHPDDLLAWYANGTLEGEERDAVEAHLRDCERCRGELEFLRRLRDQVKTTAPARSPGELGLKRLQRQLKKETRAKAPMAPSWWRPAMVVAMLVLVVQTGMLIQTWQPEPSIEPLSGAGYAGVVLQIAFAPDASAEAITASLRGAGATVIDGPSAVGIYRIKLDVDPEDEARIEEVLATLEARADVVDHVSRE